MEKCREIDERTNDKSGMSPKFLMLLIMGFFLVFLGIIILMVAAMLYGDGSANFGGVIFIWFFPIVFGSSVEASLMIIFAIILAVLSVIMFLILRRETAEENT